MSMPPAPPWWARLGRLWQPRRGLFWLMLVFNGLSALLSATLQAGLWPAPLQWLPMVLMLCNGLIGLWLAWQLLQQP